MDFSLMVWGANASNQYDLLLKAATYADQNGYSALWIPERHFHAFGGDYPNPAVTAAAVAMVTKRIRIRAGSVVVPLHHPIRIAEEWAVVDNLSGGRVELSAASGWAPQDFVLAPERYADRKALMWNGIETVQSLWRGNVYTGKDGNGATISVSTLPRPIQPELPIWVTSEGNLKTIASAGEKGFNLLTHLLGQDFETVNTKINQYKARSVRSGVRGGRVALMLHTFIGEDFGKIEEVIRKPLMDYLRVSAHLMASNTPSSREKWEKLGARDLDEIMNIAYDRYVKTASLIGTPSSCKAIAKKVREIGVDDICCLVDFGGPTDAVLQSLHYLTEVKDAFKHL